MSQPHLLVTITLLTLRLLAASTLPSTSMSQASLIKISIRKRLSSPILMSACASRPASSPVSCLSFCQRRLRLTLSPCTDLIDIPVLVRDAARADIIAVAKTASDADIKLNALHLLLAKADVKIDLDLDVVSVSELCSRAMISH